MSHALVFEKITKRFGRRLALDKCDWQVPVGTLYGLVGHNGAGKTTSLAVATGLLYAQQGRVDLLGQGPFDAKRHAGRVTLLPQDAHLPSDSHALDVLIFYARLQGINFAAARKQATELLERVHLADRARAPLRTLSHGMRKRVMVAQCFLGQPELVLLDEPLSGLDPYEVVHMRAFLKAKRKDATVVISSHNLHELELLCDYVGFMSNGRCIRADTLDNIMERRQTITYVLEQDPTACLSELEQNEAGMNFEYDASARTLTCRYPSDRFSVATWNAFLLPRLLEAGIGIASIQEGQRLEGYYTSPASH